MGWEMIPIAKLKDKYQGRAGVVMGGGPSLEGDLRRVGLDMPGLDTPFGLLDHQLDHRPVLIAVNHHGLEYVQADFTVFLDDIQNDARYAEQWELMRSRGGLKVSRQPVSDVDLYGSNWWQGRYSGHLATWLACWLGCNPVLLCGMDCYQNKAEPGDLNWAYVTPLYEHLQWWQEAFKTCPHPVRIKAVSGPLREVFGEWKG
jgi:hypothetical protein